MKRTKWRISNAHRYKRGKIGLVFFSSSLLFFPGYCFFSNFPGLKLNLCGLCVYLFGVYVAYKNVTFFDKKTLLCMTTCRKPELWFLPVKHHVTFLKQLVLFCCAILFKKGFRVLSPQWNFHKFQKLKEIVSSSEKHEITVCATFYMLCLILYLIILFLSFITSWLLKINYQPGISNLSFFSSVCTTWTKRIEKTMRNTLADVNLCTFVPEKH